MLFFSIFKESWKTVSTKILYSIILFNIDDNKKCFLSATLVLSELFLKDHVTLTTGVMLLDLFLIIIDFFKKIYPKRLVVCRYAYSKKLFWVFRIKIGFKNNTANV